MTFEEVCMECVNTPVLIKEWNRLTRHHLGEARNGIVKSIDEACGYNPDESAMPEFMRFVYNFIWLPLVDCKTGGKQE